MNFDHFMPMLKQDISSFENYWRKQHAASPELYPIEMDLPDWYEQVVVWMENNA